jgi:hypothetical protein
VILPLLKTIDLLIKHICMDHLIEEGIFSRKLISYLKQDEKNCQDVPRLFALIDVALGMIRPCETKEVSFLTTYGCLCIDFVSLSF